MKVKITILLLTSFFIISCNSEEKISLENAKFDNYFFNSKNIPVVKGKVLNLTDDEIINTKIEYSIVTPFAGNKRIVKKNGLLNPDGTFELEIDYAFPYQQIWINVGKYYYTGIYANKELYIELDANILRTKPVYINGAGVRYLGIDGAVNSLLNNHILYKRKKQLNIRNLISMVKNNKKLDYKTFLSKYDSLHALLYKIDDEFIDKNPSPYSYLIKNERMSNYYRELCDKHEDSKEPKMAKNLFKKIKKHRPYLVSNEGSTFYNYLFAYIEKRAGTYDKYEIFNFKDYSKLTDLDTKNMIEFSRIKDQVNKNQPYDTIRLKKLTRRLNLSLLDTINAFRTLKTINYIDTVFKDNKADLLKLQISSRDPQGKLTLFQVVFHNN